MADELIGKKVGGYEITGLVGQGGMATVYRAHQVSMNRTVALKMLPRQFLNDDTYLQRFNREVKIISQLEHRSIVPVHDYGEHEGQPYIVMRYMSGGSVDDVLSSGPMDPRDIVKIIEQVAPALDYAHSKSVLHRDLKPSNVLMDDGGGAYLTDFGIARILGETGSSNITTHGVVGTPSYMSPEQAQGQNLDGRSDVYSLGVMLFEMATGRRPFESDTPYSIAVMQVTTPPPPPRSYNPNLSPAIEQVIYKAMSKRREERYSTAAALADALRNAANSAILSLHDTQPGFAAPQDTTPIEAPRQAAPIMNLPAPAYSPPVSPPIPSQLPPVYNPMPANRVDAPPVSSSISYPRVYSRRRGSNLVVSAIIGVVVGCGLLAALAAVAAVVINNNQRQERDFNLTLTATAGIPASLTAQIPAAQTNAAQSASNLTTTPPALPQTASRSTPDASVPPLDGTSQTARATLVGIAVPTGTSGPVPIGQRPTPTLNAVVSQARGTLLYFAQQNNSYDLLTLDLTSRLEQQLTFNLGGDSYGAYSPDGKQIAFESDRDGDFDIYVMDSNGANLRRLTQNVVTDRLPCWSPDGQWIVFSSDVRGDSDYDLYKIHPDGTGLQLVFSDGERSSHASWSPDGRYLIFTHGNNLDGSTWEIVRLDLPTHELVTLTDNHVSDWSPNFSPDGQSIIYLTEGDGHAAIAGMDINGGSQHIVYDGAGYEWGEAYSPDGRFIAFTTGVTGRDELYLMTADGQDVQQLTSDGGMYPIWKP